jgi:hypothetical protein
MGAPKRGRAPKKDHDGRPFIRKSRSSDLRSRGEPSPRCSSNGEEHLDLRLKMVNNEGAESDMTLMHKPAGSELKRMGEPRFRGESDDGWLSPLLTDDRQTFQ